MKLRTLYTEEQIRWYQQFLRETKLARNKWTKEILDFCYESQWKSEAEQKEERERTGADFDVQIGYAYQQFGRHVCGISVVNPEWRLMNRSIFEVAANLGKRYIGVRVRGDFFAFFSGDTTERMDHIGTWEVKYAPSSFIDGIYAHEYLHFTGPRDVQAKIGTGVLNGTVFHVVRDEEELGLPRWAVRDIEVHLGATHEDELISSLPTVVLPLEKPLDATAALQRFVRIVQPNSEIRQLTKKDNIMYNYDVSINPHCDHRVSCQCTLVVTGKSAVTQGQVHVSQGRTLTLNYLDMVEKLYRTAQAPKAEIIPLYPITVYEIANSDTGYFDRLLEYIPGPDHKGSLPMDLTVFNEFTFSPQYWHLQRKRGQQVILAIMQQTMYCRDVTLKWRGFNKRVVGWDDSIFLAYISATTMHFVVHDVLRVRGLDCTQSEFRHRRNAALTINRDIQEIELAPAIEGFDRKEIRRWLKDPLVVGVAFLDGTLPYRAGESPRYMRWTKPAERTLNFAISGQESGFKDIYLWDTITQISVRIASIRVPSTNLNMIACQYEEGMWKFVKETSTKVSGTMTDLIRFFGTMGTTFERVLNTEHDNKKLDQAIINMRALYFVLPSTKSRVVSKKKK